MDAAPHGVVHACVDLAKGRRDTEKLSRLVNAVLRKVAAGGPAIWDGLDLIQWEAPKREGLQDDICDRSRVPLDGVSFCDINLGAPDIDPDFTRGFGTIFDIRVERLGDPIPEPGAALLFAAGFVVAGRTLRRRR